MLVIQMDANDFKIIYAFANPKWLCRDLKTYKVNIESSQH